MIIYIKTDLLVTTTQEFIESLTDSQIRLSIPCQKCFGLKYEQTYKHGHGLQNSLCTRCSGIGYTYMDINIIDLFNTLHEKTTSLKLEETNNVDSSSILSSDIFSRRDIVKNKLSDYLPEFIDNLKNQLAQDQERWGDTWKQRPREGQEERAFARFRDYIDQYRNAGVLVPWLKIAGEALIAWVRENHPDYKEN